MTEISIAGAVLNPSIVLPTGKMALPIKGGQANTFKAKAGEHYGNLKKKDAEEQLLDYVVAKPAGEDAKPVDAGGTRLTLESAFIQAPVAGNEAAMEAAMPGQLAQGYPPSAQGAAGASLSEANSLGDQVFAYAGADALLLAQVDTGIKPDVVASVAPDPVVASAGIGPLGLLGIVGLGVGVAAAAGGSSEPATVAPTGDTTAPSFSSSASANFAENASGTVIDVNASDNGGATDSGITYSKSGTDAAQFTINSSTGVLTFVSSPNYEAPTDSGVDNVYNLSVSATDAAGNTSTQAVAVTVSDVVESLAGQSVIDLGAYGKLIAPVQVEGAWYYFWDRSGNGTSANTGSLNGGIDFTLHEVLDGIFTSTLGEVNAGTVGVGTDTTDLIRYASLNGVRVALPTANGGVAYPQGIGALQNGTTYTDAGATTNGTATSIFNELLAIWDAYNGTGTGTFISGTPTGWQVDGYWSATPSASGHAIVDLYDGYVDDLNDNFGIYVALQVL